MPNWEDSGILLQKSLKVQRVTAPPQRQGPIKTAVQLHNVSSIEELHGALEALLGRAAPVKSLLNSVGKQSYHLTKDMLAMGQGASGRLVAHLDPRAMSADPGTLVRQLATESVELVALARALQLQARLGKHAGPPHAFPLLHVATRGGRGAVPWNELQGMPDNLVHPATPPVLGKVRTVLALFGVVIILLSGVVVLQRRSFSEGKKGSKACQRLDWEAVASKSMALDAPPKKAAWSVWDGTVAVFSCIVGTGLLAMPYAFSLAGLFAAPVMIFFVLCSGYTAHLMAWQLSAFNGLRVRGWSEGDEHQGWGTLVQQAFGTRAKCAINGFLIVELWGYLLSSTVCASMNIAQVTDDLPICGAVALSIVGTYFLTFVPIQTLTRVNVLGNFFFVVCCLMYIITGLLLPQKAPSSDVEWVRPHGFLAAAGILVFSPAGHSFYPQMMQSMEEPEKFPCCIRRAYGAGCVLYLVVGIAGYFLFGNAVQPSAVANIGVNLKLVPLPDLGWMNTVAAVGMAVKMLSMQVLVLVPLSTTIQDVLRKRVPEGVLGPVVPPLALLLTAAAAVQFANEMATLLNLIGSVFCMNIAFVMPVLCYWKLSSESVGCLQRILFIGLLLMGSTFAALGVLTCF